MSESFHGGMRKTKQDSTDVDDLPIIHKAARDGDEEVLRNVIQTSKDLLNQVDSLGLTPVIQATIAKNIHCLKILLENNASPNEKDEQGNSPLMYSISREWFEGSKLLLEHGAKISTQDQNKRNAVHLVICCKDLSIPRMILRCASFSDVNQADVEGMTPVHWAAFHNWSEQLHLLLDSSGDPSIKDKEGKTPLHWAAQNGSVASIHHLLLNGEDRDLVNLRDLEGRAPIHLAAAAGHLDVVFELAQSPGCDTESRDREGRTALHWACAMNKHRAVAGLLRLGVSYDCRDNHNATPLTYAKQANHKSCTDLLMNFDPLNPQRTLIPVDNPSDQKVNFRSNESKKMKFSENIDFNSGKAVDALTYSVRQCRSRIGSQEEALDGLNSALDGIMACQIQGKDRQAKDCNGNVVDTMADTKDPSENSAILIPAEAIIGDAISNGYSSDEDSRYLPQMAVSPPNMASPDLSESEDESFLDIHSSNAASVGVKLHRPASKKDSSSSNTSSGGQNYTLGPLRKKEVPDYLRVHSTGSDSHDMPPLKNQRVELAPLKVRREQTNPSPTTASLLGSASRLMSRESQREVLSPQGRPVGLRKKSLSLNQEVASAGADNGMKTLSRSKSYGFSISKSEPSVLPSIKPRGIMSRASDNFFKSSGTCDSGPSTSRAPTNKEERKKMKLQQPRK